MGKAYGTWSRIFDSRSEGFGFVIAANLIDDDPIDFSEQDFIGMKPVAHGNGKCHCELQVGSHGEYMIYQVGGSFYLPFGTTGRTEASFLAAEGNYLLFLTALADKS